MHSCSTITDYSLDFSEPSGLPTDVSIDVVSSTSIALSWQPPVIHDLNGIITSYHVVLRAEEAKHYEFGPDDCLLVCVIKGEWSG